MKVYSYDHNGIFSGETLADPCPATQEKILEQSARKLEKGEKKIQPVYILPAMTTEIAPPKEKAGFERVFNGSAWEYSPIKPKEDKSKEPEKNPAEIAREEKILKAVADLRKVKVDNLSLEEMRVVLGNVLFLILGPAE